MTFDTAPDPWSDSEWLVHGHRDPAVFTMPSPDDRFDVIVVGGGLAGLLTATLLAADGAHLLVVEAGRIAGRTTGHSTAKLTALHGAVYQKLRKGKGAEAARHYAAANQLAVDQLRGLLDTLEIDAGLATAVAYTVAHAEDGASTIAAELDAAQAAGLPVYATSETDLPWPIHSAVALGGQAHIDPVACCAGLVRHLRATGTTVVEGARVTAIEEEHDHCVVHIGDARLRADVVVQATHLPVVDPALLAGRTRPERSYVVAGPLVTGTPAPQGMYLSTDGGWSIRPRHGAGDDWVLVGGEGHLMTEGIATLEHYERLAAWARQWMGIEVQRRWSAFDYVSTDGVPYIGRLSPGSTRRFVATGFAKWGMSTSMVAARILGDSINGRPNPHAALFDASRVTATIGKDMVRNNAQVMKHFLGDRIKARSSAEAAAEPAPGTGVVVRQGATPVAVSCASDGTVTRLRAVCTHMGCVVQFNDGEQTWDCPCHGSRFALDGSVIDGPATSPLEPAIERDDAPEAPAQAG